MKHLRFLLLPLLLLVLTCKNTPTNQEEEEPDPTLPSFECVDGLADGKYSCENIDLYSVVSPQALFGLSQEEFSNLTQEEKNALSLNDIWGWKDPQTEKEYALVGLTDGVTFVDISDPVEPIVVGKLQESFNKANSSGFLLNGEGKKASAWRFNNYAFIVSDVQANDYGLQIFDLTKLRNATNTPISFVEDKHYSEFGDAHNIAINEGTGFAYVVGSDTYGGGLHIIDINDPLNPVFAGFHSDSTVGRRNTGYIHDTQCVNYKGPDSDYQNQELCFNSSETHLVIANVTDKQNTSTISKIGYEGRNYAHQGWLTEDHRYFLLGDELDSGNTTTYIFDVQDLDNPQLIGTHLSSSLAIDHNQYVKEGNVYQANYTSGLRILTLNDSENGNLSEVAFFDTFPANNDRMFDGAWSNYPFFESGLVIVSDISNGLFILKPNL